MRNALVFFAAITIVFQGCASATNTQPAPHVVVTDYAKGIAAKPCNPTCSYVSDDCKKSWTGHAASYRAENYSEQCCIENADDTLGKLCTGDEQEAKHYAAFQDVKIGVICPIDETDPLKQLPNDAAYYDPKKNLVLDEYENSLGAWPASIPKPICQQN